MIPSVNYLLPIIKEPLEKLFGSTVFSGIDLEKGFNQFSVAKKDQEKTTFTWNAVSYCFVSSIWFQTCAGCFSKSYGLFIQRV
jgi:hypothetical protein